MAKYKKYLITLPTSKFWSIFYASPLLQDLAITTQCVLPKYGPTPAPFLFFFDLFKILQHKIVSNLTSEIEKSVPKCDRDLNPGPQDVGSVQTDPLDLQRNVYTFNSLRYIRCLLLFPKSRK